MADVFISYAREDRAAADQIARGLQAIGLECFWDTEIPPGQTWADYIEGKLAACKAVIVVWSAHSVGSQWVREEARMGRDKGKLVPVVLGGASPPFGFGEVQAADLSTWRGEPNAPEWSRLANAVHQIVRGSPALAPRAPQRAAFVSQPNAATGALSPLGYIQKCFRLYADGKGRARRAEYGWWLVFAFVAALVAYGFDLSAFGLNPYTQVPNTQAFGMVLGLALLTPNISVMSRRFHDLGLSGWLTAGVFGAYALASVIALEAPAIGGSIVLVLLAALVALALWPGKPGTNQYGPNPKGI